MSKTLLAPFFLFMTKQFTFCGSNLIIYCCYFDLRVSDNFISMSKKRPLVWGLLMYMPMFSLAFCRRKSKDSMAQSHTNRFLSPETHSIKLSNTIPKSHQSRWERNIFPYGPSPLLIINHLWTPRSVRTRKSSLTLATFLSLSIMKGYNLPQANLRSFWLIG